MAPNEHEHMLRKPPSDAPWHSVVHIQQNRQGFGDGRRFQKTENLKVQESEALEALVNWMRILVAGPELLTSVSVGVSCLEDSS